MDEQTTLCTFVAGLPVSEYDFEIRQLSRKLTFDRDEVINTMEASEEQGAEGETALLVQMRAVLVEILDEEVQDEEMQEAEKALSGYVFDELLDSLATSPPDYDAHESASNVLSLTCETADNAPNEIALVTKETQGKSELESDFEMPSGPVSDAEILLYR